MFKKFVAQQGVIETQVVSVEFKCRISNVQVILKMLHMRPLWRLWHKKILSKHNCASVSFKCRTKRFYQSTNVLLSVVSAGQTLSK